MTLWIHYLVRKPNCSGCVFLLNCSFILQHSQIDDPVILWGHMKHARYSLLVAALLFISSSSVAYADPVSQPGSPTEPLPFTVTCSPYTAPMISSVTYSPDGGACTFTIPQQHTYKVVGIYKGVPGSSVPVKRGFTISNPSTVLTDTGYNFSGAQDGDSYFAASYSSDVFNEALGTDGYLQNGSGTNVPDLTISDWHWGVTPPVSISSPEPGRTYSSGDSVLPLVNFDDPDSYTSILYTLNGTPVDPNLPLPIANLPSGPATLVVAATNASGTTYATSTFSITGGRTPLTVTADNVQMELGSPVPTLTATLSGFMAPDTATTSDITGSPSCTTTANSGSAPGTYPIVCTQGTLESPHNYAFTFFVTGTLTVVDFTNPAVAITAPIDGHTYLKSQSVIPSATITDYSPIANTTYTFNGVAVNPSSPLVFSSLPNSTTTVTFVVSATDLSGNKGFATSTFKVAPVPATPPPPTDYTAPVITINTPLKNGIYSRSDTVFLTATVTDTSSIATTTYWFNGVKINPLVKLPLTNAPLVNKVTVTAKDVYGNTATSTRSFFVVKSTNSCLLDIILILTAIKQDKTYPDKPTIENLIADCSALFRGFHRYDDDGHHY
jgi:hypothetical protein